jgi:hypothetical protein
VDDAPVLGDVDADMLPDLTDLGAQRDSLPITMQ